MKRWFVIALAIASVAFGQLGSAGGIEYDYWYFDANVLKSYIDSIYINKIGIAELRVGNATVDTVLTVNDSLYALEATIDTVNYTLSVGDSSFVRSIWVDGIAYLDSIAGHSPVHFLDRVTVRDSISLEGYTTPVLTWDAGGSGGTVGPAVEIYTLMSSTGHSFSEVKVNFSEVTGSDQQVVAEYYGAIYVIPPTDEWVPVPPAIAVSDTLTIPAGWSGDTTFVFGRSITNSSASYIGIRSLSNNRLLATGGSVSGAVYYGDSRGYTYDTFTAMDLEVYGGSLVSGVVGWDPNSQEVSLPDASIENLTADSIYARSISVDTLHGHSPITIMDDIIAGGSITLGGVTLGEWFIPDSSWVVADADTLTVDSLLTVNSWAQLAGFTSSSDIRINNADANLQLEATSGSPVLYFQDGNTDATFGRVAYSTASDVFYMKNDSTNLYVWLGDDGIIRFRHGSNDWATLVDSAFTTDSIYARSISVETLGGITTGDSTGSVKIYSNLVGSAGDIIFDSARNIVFEADSGLVDMNGLELQVQSLSSDSATSYQYFSSSAAADSLVWVQTQAAGDNDMVFKWVDDSGDAYNLFLDDANDWLQFPASAFGNLITPDDAGMVAIFNRDVTGSAVAGTAQGVIMRTDTVDVASMGALADGSGSVEYPFMRMFGGVYSRVIEVTTAYTATLGDNTIIVTDTLNVTLPALSSAYNAAGNYGLELFITLEADAPCTVRCAGSDSLAGGTEVVLSRWDTLALKAGPNRWGIQ